MKKKVKALVIATSVAAIAGIGAVSFAAWTKGATTVTPSGTTGILETYGISVKTNNLDGKVLVPYNQTEEITNMVKMWEIELETVGTQETGANYSYTINFATDSNSALNNAMYFYTGSTALSDAPSDISTDWTKISGTAQAITPVSNKVYIVLDSDTAAEMGKTAKVEIKLVKA